MVDRVRGPLQLYAKIWKNRPPVSRPLWSTRWNAFNLYLHICSFLWECQFQKGATFSSMDVPWGSVPWQKKSNMWIPQNLIWFPLPPLAMRPWTKHFNLLASVPSSVRLGNSGRECSLTWDSLGKLPATRRHSMDVEMDWGLLMIHNPATIYVLFKDLFIFESVCVCKWGRGEGVRNPSRFHTERRDPRSTWSHDPKITTWA